MDAGRPVAGQFFHDRLHQVAPDALSPRLHQEIDMDMRGIAFEDLRNFKKRMMYDMAHPIAALPLSGIFARVRMQPLQSRQPFGLQPKIELLRIESTEDITSGAAHAVESKGEIRLE